MAATSSTPLTPPSEEVQEHQLPMDATVATIDAGALSDASPGVSSEPAVAPSASRGLVELAGRLRAWCSHGGGRLRQGTMRLGRAGLVLSRWSVGPRADAEHTSMAPARDWSWLAPVIDLATIGVTLAVGVTVGMSVARRLQAPAIRPDTSAAMRLSVPVTASSAGPSPATERVADYRGTRAPDTVTYDWADSALVPPWVYAPTTPDGLTREYVRLGSASPSVRIASPPSTIPARASGDERSEGSYRSSTVDGATIAPIVVQRVGGPRVVGYDVGLIPHAQPITAVSWSVPGRCSTPVVLEERPQPGVAVTGHELGSTGDWLFALAVPEVACRAVRGRAALRAAPTSRERRGLAYATQTSPVPRELGAPGFAENDLKEFVVAPWGAGGRLAWAVFRHSVMTTQVYPPPPTPQLAVVARSADGERWEILWAKYTNSPSETVALAGAYDVDHDGVLDGFFAVRAEQGSRLLHVSHDATGVWRLVRTLPL